MENNELAFLLRVLDEAKEPMAFQFFNDGSQLTFEDLVASRLLAFGLKLEYNHEHEQFTVRRFKVQ